MFGYRNCWAHGLAGTPRLVSVPIPAVSQPVYIPLVNLQSQGNIRICSCTVVHSHSVGQLERQQQPLCSQSYQQQQQQSLPPAVAVIQSLLLQQTQHLCTGTATSSSRRLAGAAANTSSSSSSPAVNSYQRSTTIVPVYQSSSSSCSCTLSLYKQCHVPKAFPAFACPAGACSGQVAAAAAAVFTTVKQLTPPACQGC